MRLFTDEESSLAFFFFSRRISETRVAQQLLGATRVSHDLNYIYMVIITRFNGLNFFVSIASLKVWTLCYRVYNKVWFS